MIVHGGVSARRALAYNAAIALAAGVGALFVSIARATERAWAGRAGLVELGLLSAGLPGLF